MKRFAWLLGVVLLGVAGCRSVSVVEKHAAGWSDRPGYVLLLAEPESNTMLCYGDAAAARKRYPPCSTFKIISTLAGLEAGVVSGPEARLGYDGTRYEYESWNRDVTLKEAFRASCVWYYKKLTGKLDKVYVRRVLERLDYGNCDISVWNSNGHNVFWIESSLLISPEEQLAVLERIFSGASGFTAEQVGILKDCMRYDDIGPVRFFGKTGTGRNHITNRLEAWCVGLLEFPGGKRWFFATHGADPDNDVSSAALRESIRSLVAAGLADDKNF